MANDMPLIDDGFQFRALGAKRPRQTFTHRTFESVFTVLPESEWREGSVMHWNVPIWDQGQYGSCGGHAAGTAFSYLWAMSGQSMHEFSPTSVYARCNGGRDEGCVVADTLTCLKNYGICFMSEFGENKIYLSQMSVAAKKTALRFRVIEAYKISNWQQMGTALTRGMVVVSGIGVGNNFSNLDRNGVAPLPDRVIGGHALAQIGLRKVDGTWVATTQNSWGSRWGSNGFCYLQKDAWHPQFGFPFDAYALASVLDDPEETETDPPVLVV